MRYLIFLVVVFCGLLISCGGDESEDIDEEAYSTAVSDFYVSLAASQTEEARFAFNKMNDVATSFPQEPAAWANLGVMAMRQGNFDLAEDRFSQARELVPQNSDILFLSGLFESRRGNIDEAVEYLRSALDAAPDNQQIQFALIDELERQDDVENADEIINRVRSLYEAIPDNRAFLLEAARISAKEQESDLLRNTIRSLSVFNEQWNDEARELFQIVSDAAEEEEFADLNFELSFLRNAIEPTPAFQADLREIQLEPNQVGFLINWFIVLPEPEFRASDPDMGVSFSDFEESELPEHSSFVKSATLLEERPPFPLYVQEEELILDTNVTLSFPAEMSSSQISPNAMAEIDYNYNFRNDIALVGDQGFKLYRQEEDQTFTDVSSSLGVSNSILNGNYRGVWPADVDLDGDLDLVLAPVDGSPFALRNNSDDSFTPENLFDEIQNATDFMWADLDNDGASDALFRTDAGELVMYRNQRSGIMDFYDQLPADGTIAAFTISDIDASGTFDIIVLYNDSRVEQLKYLPDEDRWEARTLFEIDTAIEDLAENTTTLYASDMDNNGSFDIIISTEDETQIWLSDSEFTFRFLDISLPGGVTSIFDINGNNRLDLLGRDSDGRIFQKINSGTKDYNARSIRARASGTEGDQRINSFGIGGDMEIRSGLLYQKQLIRSPIVHFGLGTFEEAEMLRIIWPNGSVQAEFAELGMGSTIFNEQILKGSCPWLFTNDGEEIQFITDILWRSPLGLRINAQETAGVIQTLDRVRIPGEQLNPANGVYDLRITAELWETHFFDHVSLVAVDHPEETEIFVDERFVFPAPDLSTKAMTKPNPVKSVTDQNGTDWTETVSETDGTYMKPFQKTSYQGVVEDHYVEIELGDDVPADDTIYLIASGWLRPTDSSINLAISQGKRKSPEGLRVEISDGEGNWNELHENYGVPAGKTKSILLELDDVFPDPDDRRIRFHTTSEIYWDSIQWASGVSSDQITETNLDGSKMELRYRGYSEWERADSVSPMLPVYDEISSTHQRWRDLVGYHTRFGDVNELLDEVDDRYVIMNAGDEMVLEFEFPGEPEPGYTRSFIFVSDGWVKDGDYNTAASKTVTPLPSHGQSDYEYGKRQNLMQDPVYQQHKEDWLHYHTRFITPEPFRTAILINREQAKR